MISNSLRFIDSLHIVRAETGMLWSAIALALARISACVARNGLRVARRPGGYRDT